MLKILKGECLVYLFKIFKFEENPNTISDYLILRAQ